VHAFKLDLGALGLRVDAGESRDRGGHDLRAWFVTTCQEHGAHRDLLRVVTHTSKSDVVSGYTRATWPALCAEVGKLRVSLKTGDLVQLSAGSLQRSEAAATTRKKARPQRGATRMEPEKGEWI